MTQFWILFSEWLTKPKYDFMHGWTLVKKLSELSKVHGNLSKEVIDFVNENADREQELFKLDKQKQKLFGVNGKGYDELAELECEIQEVDIQIYKDFARRIKEIRKKLYNFISTEVLEGKTFACLAASTRGNSLLQALGVTNGLIRFAIERNPEKWKKKFAGLQIPIVSEEEGRIRKPDYMLLLPWFFASEITKRETDYLNNEGKILIPLPQPKLITKDGEIIL